ncbi:MAG TPA: exonuclease SbcCD subunit D [Egicoccus sp.]|nr:exonuclease SbcCD subunit D [Egicoccus sp.]HSK22427.1 exonuclease SbcCD subunit D [Egicoccus sp.]
MRILHTSDWHVGRTVRGRSRADEHRAVLAEIAGIAHESEVDLILVAGDQFDTGAPSAESEAIVYRALLDLAATGAHVVVLAGNHDNPRRWAAIRPLLELGNVHLADRIMRPDQGGVLDLPTPSGEVARVALVPFLSQRSIVTGDQLMAHDAAQQSSTYADRARRIIGALTADFGSGDTVDVVVGHLTVATGAPSLGGGERHAHTIFDYVVPPQAFPPSAHYVALGHLHLPHKVSGPAPTWYSGSPLHLDFGEADRGAKQVLLVEVTPDTPARVGRVDLHAGRRMRTLRGSVEQVLAHGRELGDDYLRVLLDEAPRPGLADQVRQELPQAVDVSIVRDEDGSDTLHDDTSAFDADDLRQSPVALFGEYLAEQGIEDPRLDKLFAELLDDATTDGEGDRTGEATSERSERDDRGGGGDRR